jgi:anti-anti-sigma regulatory factor
VSGELSDASAIDDPESITLGGRVIPKGVEIYEVNGPFFFGAADKIREVVGEIEKPRALILRMRNVPAIDATGIHALEQLALKCKSQGTMLILAEVLDQPLSVLARARRADLFATRLTTRSTALGSLTERAHGQVPRPQHPRQAPPAQPGRGSGLRAAEEDQRYRGPVPCVCYQRCPRLNVHRSAICIGHDALLFVFPRSATTPETASSVSDAKLSRVP